MLSSVVLMGLLVTQVPPAPVAVPDLLESVKTGDLQRVRDSLGRGASIDVADRRGWTPLLWSAAAGNAAVVRELLDRGAAVNYHASDGTTALMVAAGNGFTESVRVLLLRGADPAAVRSGSTARQIALERGQSGVVALFDQTDALGRRLLQAATEGNDTVVRQVLALGAPIDMPDERGATALMIAARNGDLGILQALLPRGADPSMRDSSGDTVFEWAQRSPSTAKFVLAFLQERGASKDPPRASASPQSQQVKASLARLMTVLGRVPPASVDVRNAQRRATTALARLQELSNKWPAESPADYRENLAGDISALEAALQQGQADTLSATLDAVAEDLEVKLEHCLKSGGTLGGSIVVSVRTLRGDAESRSWQVFYMPRVFEAAPNARPDLFPQLSSPTQESLVPGRYVMWVRDPATARLGERTVVKVGEGRKEMLVDLPVPAAAP